MALNGTVSEVITENSGLVGHLHLSHDNTVIRNLPLQSTPDEPDNLLKPSIASSSSKLMNSSMSSSILSSSLKLAKQLLEENKNISVDTDKKSDPPTVSGKDAIAGDIVSDTKPVTETQQNKKFGDKEKYLPVVHHVDRFRPITFKLFMQEQVTAVSMGTLHTAFVTGKYISCHTL